MATALSLTEEIRPRVMKSFRVQQSMSLKRQETNLRDRDMENLIDVLSLQTRVQENKSKENKKSTNYR